MNNVINKIKTIKPTLFLGAIIERHHRQRCERFARCGRLTHQHLRPASLVAIQAARLIAALLLIASWFGFATNTSAAEPLTNWTARTSPYGTTNNWRAVAFGNGKFVAVNQSAGRVNTSTNGTNWLPYSANTNKALYGLAFGGGKFVAAGNGGLVMTSTDGTSWQPRNSGTTAHLYNVSYGNGQFVTVGESGVILSSPDGVTWTARNTGNTNKWAASTFGNGMNVVVGYRTQGSSFTRSAASPNFSNWDVRDTGQPYYLSGVAFGLGKFVAVGYNGVIQNSTDGANWTPPVASNGAWLYKVAFDNNTFVAVGENVIVTSTNGTAWEARFAKLSKTMQGVAYGNDTWVVVGNNGLILQSAPVSAATPGGVALTEAARAGSQFSFKFNGSIGQSYQVQASTKLTHWTTLTNLVCTSSPTSCTLGGQTMPKRFYRVVKP